MSSFFFLASKTKKPIYVEETALYIAANDRLQRRGKLIRQKLKELLTDKTHVRNLRIQYEDDYHLGEKTVEYRRYHVVFSWVQTG